MKKESKIKQLIKVKSSKSTNINDKKIEEKEDNNISKNGDKE